MPPVRGVPTLDGTVQAGGLDVPIEIFRDSSGVPHVRAKTTHDAFFGQGFVHAQDRLWQMVYDRRRAEGRLSEWLGPREPVRILDVFVRRMGLAESARSDHEQLNDETKDVLEAYTAGVNAFLRTNPPLPLELQLLEIDAVEDWEPWHCGAVLKVRHVLMGTFGVKLWRQRLVDALGPSGRVSPGSSHEREDLLIVPVGATETYNAPLFVDAAQPDGSNNWAVHGSRTKSGKPLVAGDPHRALEAPNVYYQNHIACPDFDAIGFSMAGVPGMFHFGHNERVAWCVTHAMADTQDLYLERPEDIIETRRETIGVRGASDITFDVQRTKRGPIVITDPLMSLRWTGTDGFNTSLQTILPTLRARTVHELDDVMRDWVDPCNNLVMADIDGAIAYLCRGRFPIRSKANAWTPVPGWTGEHEWTGDVPYDELPRLRDPVPGFIVTANNRIVGNDYPYFLGMDYSQPGRAERILARLQELDGATNDDMASVHAERVSMPGLIMRAAFGLEDWDGSMDPDSREALVYYAIRDELAAVLCERGPLAKVVENPYASDEPYPSPAHYRIRTALPRIIDTDLVDDDAIREATQRALAKIDDGATWGDVHKTKTVHPVFRAVPDEALNPPVVSMGGDGDTPQAGSEEKGLGIVHSAVARYAFDLGDWDNSGWIVPTGSSGHPDSPHYADQAQDWADVKLRPMLYSWDRIEADAETRQTLSTRR